jgi:carbamate kinase
MTELHRLYIDYTTAPMSVCSAMSQGYVGYDIQNSLRAELISRGDSTTVATILTQVSVDPYDEAFYNPSKKIGRYMSKEDADNEIKKGNYVVEVPGKGWQRIIAAPKPLEILEIDAIRALVNAGEIVIACGGGGIPVIVQEGALRGASAVIEKDAIAGKLASDLSVDELMILTSVPCVYRNFGQENQEAISRMNVREAEELIEAGAFGKTNMEPKIEASIEYLKAVPGGRVLITKLDSVSDALGGKTGTVITA